MELASNIRRTKSKANYYMWVGVFCLIVFGVIGTIYVATDRIEYVWQWYKVPSAFVYHEPIPVEADIDGTVGSITVKGKETVIQVKGDSGEVVSYTAPEGELRVDEGDFVSMGDTLAIYKRWRPGILLQGLWITLEVSFFAIIFGILIGLIGGIARISHNPALKWSAIVYVEMIRGSPLLVQIFQLKLSFQKPYLEYH